MKTVNPFEARLLRILHAFLERTPPQQALEHLRAGFQTPDCLSRDSIDLVQDALGKGLATLLAKTGGWRRERFLRQDVAAEGRLWRRTAPERLGLAFSAATLDFLIWATATSMNHRTAGSDAVSWTPPNELTDGDRLLLFLAFSAVRGAEIALRWRRLSPFYQDGLCRLMFADEFATVSATPLLHFEAWLNESGVAVVESMQDRLAKRWVEMEQSKRAISSVAQMQELGSSQKHCLDAFLDAIDAAGRRDLSRFMLVAARRLLSGAVGANAWIGALDISKQRMAGRTAVFHAATAFLQSLLRLQQWQKEALHVGYFDEGYAASQLWKSDWERHEGDKLCDTARRIIRETEPFRGKRAHPGNST